MNKMNFDCKVCDKCLKAMTAMKYWDHNCETEVVMAKDTTEDRVKEIETELDDIRYELDGNQLEQEELRGLERGLEERIEELETELENIEDEDEV